MALPATENFNRSDEALQDSSDWAVVDGSLAIVSNEIDPNSTGGNIGIWQSDSFDDDQYAQMVLSDRPANFNYIGAGVRLTGTGSTDTDGYVAYVSSNALKLERFDNDTITNLGTDSTVYNDGDTVKIESNGSTIRALIDDVEKLSNTDSTHTSGAAGIAGYWNQTSKGDDWEGGNLSVATGNITPLLGRIRRSRSPLLRM